MSDERLTRRASEMLDKVRAAQRLGKTHDLVHLAAAVQELSTVMEYIMTNSPTFKDK